MENEDELLLLYLKGRQLAEKNRTKHRFWVWRIFNERKWQRLYHTIVEGLRLFNRKYIFFFSQQTLHIETVTRKALHIGIHFDRSIARSLNFVSIWSLAIAGIEHFPSRRSWAIAIVYDRRIVGKCFHMTAVDRAGSLAHNSDREWLLMGL